MYRILLCEDSADDRCHMEELLRRAFSELGEPYRLSWWESAEGMLTETVPYSFDIAIFDVELGKMNGIEASRRLRASDKEVIILFTSSHPEYVFSSFPSEPLNYLVKPVAYDMLLGMVKESVKRIEESRTTVFSFEAKGVLYSVPVKEIVRLESHARIVRLKTRKDDYQFYGKLDDVAKDERFSAFIRCHKSYLVNPLYIEKVARDSVCLSTGESVPVSHGNMRRVKSELIAYLNGDSLA